MPHIGHVKSKSTWGDEDGIGQVQEEDDGIVAFGKGRTHIYKGDENGIDQIKKEGQSGNLDEVRTCIDIS